MGLKYDGNDPEVARSVTRSYAAIVIARWLSVTAVVITLLVLWCG